MKISIITIVLNDETNIAKTIQSIINQKNKNIEYIIIDGKSKDNTIPIINQYKKHIDIFISEKDNGISDAFNKGIEVSTGDIIGFINSGDFLEDSSIYTIYNEFKKNNIDILYGKTQYWQNNKKMYTYRANHKYLKQFMSINHPSVFVKKDIYNKYGLFDKSYKYAMDYELMLRFYINNANFKYINKTLSNMSLGGISDKNWEKTYKESYLIRKKYIQNHLLYIKYIYQVTKRHISNNLYNIGLENIITFYRKYISTIKKEKN
jgi:glycosyltransferase involved in cell wall biosynthesis